MIECDFQIDLSPLQALTPAKMRKILKISINRASRQPKQSVMGQAEQIKRYGYLAKSIRIKVRVYDNGNGVAVIGPSSTYNRTKGKFSRGKKKGQPRKFFPAKYAHLIERGTKRSKATPFLTPALNNSKEAFARDVCDSIQREIETTLSRAK